MVLDESEWVDPWYRCCRCRAVFKLKNLIIRHLISHKVHRFETDSDWKCAEDWERVMYKDGAIVKWDLPKEEPPPPPPAPAVTSVPVSVIQGTPVSLPLQEHRVQHQQSRSHVITTQADTTWVVPSSSASSDSDRAFGADDGSTATLTVITLQPGGAEEEHSYVGPFDPIISQALLRLGVGDGTAEVITTTSAGSTSTTEAIAGSSSEEQFRCRYCGAPFAHSRARAVHEAKVHNEEIDGYPCQLCNKNFPTIASVQDHYRCTHKITPPIRKAWKSWKTQGGSLNDYVILTCQGPSDQVSVSGAQVMQQSTGTVYAISPVTREIVLDASNSSIIPTNSMVMASQSAETVTIPTQNQGQHQRYETFYYQPETGSIIATSSQSEDLQIHLEEFTPAISETVTIKQEDTTIVQAPEPEPAPLPPKKKRQRKTKAAPSTDSVDSSGTTPSPTKKAKPSPSSPPVAKKSSPSRSQKSPSPKLPKDSPYRYQRLKCPKCEERFRTQWEQTVHLGDVHAEFTCEFCNQIFSQKVEMVKHQYTAHNTELGYYQCHFCRRNLSSPRIVQEHVASVHGEKKVPSTSVALKWRRA